MGNVWINVNKKNEDWDCVDLCNFVNQVYDGENSSYFKEFSTKYRQNTDVTDSAFNNLFKWYAEQTEVDDDILTSKFHIFVKKWGSFYLANEQLNEKNKL